MFPGILFADIPTATPNCRLDSYPFCRRSAHAVRAETRRYGSEQGTCPLPLGSGGLLPGSIKQERRWELAFESIRWWDILRWSGPSLEEAGDILNKQTGFNIINAATVVPMVKFDYKKRLQATQGYWPIPQDEIDISNGVLEQNPGWDASAQFSDWNNM